MNTYTVRIDVGTVEARTYEEARAKALVLLENLSASNDGREVLANAEPELSVS